MNIGLGIAGLAERHGEIRGLIRSIHLLDGWVWQTGGVRRVERVVRKCRVVGKGWVDADFRQRIETANGADALTVEEEGVRAVRQCQVDGELFVRFVDGMAEPGRPQSILRSLRPGRVTSRCGHRHRSCR